MCEYKGTQVKVEMTHSGNAGKTLWCTTQLQPFHPADPGTLTDDQTLFVRYAPTLCAWYICFIAVNNRAGNAVQGAEWAEDHSPGGHPAAPHPDAHPELLLSRVVRRDGP